MEPWGILLFSHGWSETVDKLSWLKYFLFAAVLREICSIGATAPKPVSDNSAELQKEACALIPVDVKPSLSLPLHLPSFPVSPSLRKEIICRKKDASPSLCLDIIAHLSLKDGFVPQSPWRLKSRKYHPTMMANCLCFVHAHLCQVH